MKTIISQEKAKQFYSELVEDCKKSFTKAGVFLHNPGIRIDDSSIEISVVDNDGKSLFASDIQIYAKGGLFDRVNEINFGSSGSFTPETESSYWRTIHAATVLQNWETVCNIVNEYCVKHKEFYSIL